LHNLEWSEIGFHLRPLAQVVVGFVVNCDTALGHCQNVIRYRRNPHRILNTMYPSSMTKGNRDSPEYGGCALCFVPNREHLRLMAPLLKCREWHLVDFGLGAVSPTRKTSLWLGGNEICPCDVIHDFRASQRHWHQW